MHSVKRGVGYFFFENGLWQQFQLQLCEKESSIKCYITIHSHKPSEEILDCLLQQRRALVKHLRDSVIRIIASCMPSAKKPLVFLDCPFEHSPDCPPHLDLNIDDRTLLICQCNVSRTVKKVDEKQYIQLFEPHHILRNSKLFVCTLIQY